MPTTLNVVSDSIKQRANTGAYERPFSGVGIEFDPLGVKPGRTGITLHESGYLPANAEWNFPAVFSPFWRLYYNAKRGHCVVFGEQITELTPGHLMLIPPHSMFHCLGGNPVPTFWLAFSFTRKPASEQPVPILLPPRDTELCLIRDLEILIAAAGGEPGDSIYRNSLALLHVVLSRSELRWQPPLPENMVRIQAYIEARLRTKLLCPALAKLAGLSAAGFNRAFKHHFGTTPMRYVSEMRVREATRLLLQSDETIETIAEKTGFPNRAYFGRVFKQVINESPATFRRKHQGVKGSL